MFLTVGEKLKQCRKKYNIKQIHFESYGFSASYISMIEKGVREAPKETVEQIYQVLIELTNKEVEQIYSLDRFLMDEKEEARLWLEENSTTEMALNDYEYYKSICLKYNLKDYRIKLDENLAYYYQKKQKYNQSNQYFASCIYQSVNHQDMLSKYYHEIGINYQKCGSYHEAIINFKLSIFYTPEENESLKYKNEYDLAKINYFLNDLNQSYSYLEKILNNCNDLEIIGATVLLKEIVLKKDGKVSEAVNLLKEFINNESFTPYFKYAYHNLGCTLKEQGKYTEAILTIESGFKYFDTDLDKALSIFLQGDIYYDLKEFSKARLLYEESKNILLEQSNLYNKKTIVKRLIQLYFQQNDICFIGTLIDDVKKICDPIQQKELINIIKVEIYKNLLNNNVQFIPLLNEYLA